MRITNNVIISNMMNHLQHNLKRLDELNQQLSSGLKFQNPSENPVGVANSMQYNSLINNSEQYKRNVDQALSWISSSETALDQAGDVLERAKVLAVDAANGDLSEDERKDIALEVEQLLAEMVSIGNSKLGDNYLFGGQKIASAPFEPDGSYTGDSKKIYREINPGVQIDINVIGERVFGSAIAALKSFKNHLENNDSEAISADLILIDEAIVDNTTYRAELGAKTNRLELTSNRLEDTILNLTELLSKNEDIDLAETITDLKMEETVYRASLASNARIMQPTLVDFLQ